jgi:hypothetical protein
VLYITTTYPETFVAGPQGLLEDEELDLASLFG